MKLYHRSKFAQTAFALNGVPSWKRTPVRSLNVHTRPPFVAVHDFASFGTTIVVPDLSPTRPSVIWSITRSDSPSETTAPSSDVGSAAVPKTSVSLAADRLFAASVAAAAISATTIDRQQHFQPFAHRSPLLPKHSLAPAGRGRRTV